MPTVRLKIDTQIEGHQDAGHQVAGGNLPVLAVATSLGDRVDKTAQGRRTIYSCGCATENQSDVRFQLNLI